MQTTYEPSLGIFAVLATGIVLAYPVAAAHAVEVVVTTYWLALAVEAKGSEMSA